MKKIGKLTLSSFSNKILNIHPALLPKFGGEKMYGQQVHVAVLSSGEKISGATVHLIDENYDTGRILRQSKVPVKPDDTAETLAARVLEIEHRLYSAVINDIANGKIKLNARI